MRITTLLENHPSTDQPHLEGEHGLSFYIEHPSGVFLSDVGMTELFADNAHKLGKDLNLVEGLAISHHHFDHGGGLARFFEENEAGHRLPAEDTGDGLHCGRRGTAPLYRPG